MSGAATLERIEAGYRVAVIYRPSLARPTGAVLAAYLADGSPLESRDVAATDALEAFRHPALTLPALAEYLTRRPDPMPLEDPREDLEPLASRRAPDEREDL